MLRWQEEWLTLGWDYSLKERWWRGGKTRGAFVGRQRADAAWLHSPRKSPLRAADALRTNLCYALSLAGDLPDPHRSRQRTPGSSGWARGHFTLSGPRQGRERQSNRDLLQGDRLDSSAGPLPPLVVPPLAALPAQAPQLCMARPPFADLSTHFGARGLATDLWTRPRHSSARANIGRKVPRCVAGN